MTAGVRGRTFAMGTVGEWVGAAAALAAAGIALWIAQRGNARDDRLRHEQAVAAAQQRAEEAAEEAAERRWLAERDARRDAGLLTATTTGALTRGITTISVTNRSDAPVRNLSCISAHPVVDNGAERQDLFWVVIPEDEYKSFSILPPGETATWRGKWRELKENTARNIQAAPLVELSWVDIDGRAWKTGGYEGARPDGWRPAPWPEHWGPHIDAYDIG
ncbi:hypothetical protein M3693_04655 [Cellulosimicrobium funkei]|uniref:hypothetical protein n=1 Tax=Cellulosimicrobium funkei TaxID=264251 RepID=UPI00203EEB32|nr:hypothetical protein [Cellulosimicrobium funkei]MCM3533515.1 hypothetical protein [Cellulosimicrobium funkei]